MPPKKAPPNKNTAGKDKRPAKSAAKTAKKKRASGKTPASAPSPPEVITDKAAEKRVSQMREKLKKSMADPDMRDQIVQAIRSMLNEGRS